MIKLAPPCRTTWPWTPDFSARNNGLLFIFLIVYFRHGEENDPLKRATGYQTVAKTLVELVFVRYVADFDLAEDSISLRIFLKLFCQAFPSMTDIKSFKTARSTGPSMGEIDSS